MLPHASAEVLAEELDGAFLHCPRCAAVHRASTVDRAPVYECDGTPHPADDLQVFLGRHDGHDLAVLWRASDVEVHSHARHDPMRQVFWEVSDGDLWFVVSFGREDVESPRTYRMTPGRLEPLAESIEIDAGLVREVLDEALYPLAAAASALDAFVAASREAISDHGWERFEPIDEDRDNPNVQLACLPEVAAGRLLAAADRLFDAVEAERIKELVRGELRGEIPIVRLTRSYAVPPLPLTRR
jgi:hypothetical protein